MRLRLLIVRHGQTDWNVAGRFQGQSDIPLNAVGLDQAAAAARRFARTASAGARLLPAGSGSEPAIAAIYASDLRRAWQTAEIIHASISNHLAIPLIPEPRLREMSFGKWEGLTYAEIRDRFPADLSRWHADMQHAPPPEGEPFPAFAGRIEAAYAAILAAHPGQTALIVAHGGPLQTLIALALGLPAASFWQFHLSNASLSEIKVYPEGAILNLLNDCAHLE